LEIPQRGYIFIAPLAFHKLKTYIECCPVEIGGLGEVELRGDHFVITDVLLISQRVTPSETALDPDQVCALLSQYLARGRDPASLRVWWHSHGETDAYWSRTDQQTIEAFPGEYLISIVGNKWGQFRCRLDIFAPTRQTVEALDLVPLGEPVPAGTDDPDRLRSTIREEIRTKVKIFLPVDPVELQEWVIATEPEDVEVDLDRFDHDPDQASI